MISRRKALAGLGAIALFPSISAAASHGCCKLAGGGFSVSPYASDWGETLRFGVAADRQHIYGVGTKEVNQYAVSHAGTQWNPDSNALPSAHFRPYITRRFLNGQLDTTFGAGGIAWIEDYRVNANTIDSLIVDWEMIDYLELSNGQLVGSFIYYDQTTFSYGAARFNRTGTLDNSFGTNGVTIHAVNSGAYFSQCWAGQRSDGEIFLGSTRVLFGVNRPQIIALLPNGQIDTSWGTSGLYEDNISGGLAVYVMTMQGDNIIIGGINVISGNHTQWVMSRILGATGTLDTTFGASGYTYLDFPNAGNALIDGGILIQGDGKLVVAGQAAYDGSGHSTVALARFSADGILDTSFGSSGISVHASGIQANDDCGNAKSTFFDGTKIVQVGLTYSDGSSYHSPTQSIVVRRYLSDGSLDTGFGTGGFLSLGPFGGDTGGNEVAYSAALAPDGSYYVSGHIFAGEGHGAGHTGSPGGSSGITLKISNAGVLDTTFGTGLNSGTPPSVTTNAATSVGSTTATTHATVNPNSISTYWVIQYGLASGRYSLQTPLANAGHGSVDASVSANLSGLISGTTYYARAIAWSTSGYVMGSEVSFTTS